MDFDLFKVQDGSLRRLLTAETDSEEAYESRLEKNFQRTMEFLWVFGIFSLGYCTLSMYMYRNPHDSPRGSSLASRIRRIPVLSWFYRQPQSAKDVSTADESEIEHLTKDDIELGGTKAGSDKSKSPRGGDNVNKAEKAQEAPGPRLLIMGSENMTLAVCALLLLMAYLSWGFMQERIMGHPYGDPDLESSWFHSSEFCVLINRLAGLLVSSIVLLKVNGSGNDCPPFYYSLCALSNMMSSWFQYEALHYVTFPVQTIFKSSKVLITMLVGKLMGKSFPLEKYGTAIVIAIGVTIFLMAQKSEDKNEKEIEGWYLTLGCVLISGYAFCDAFTSNWQSKIFAATKVSSLEMMQGVNAFTFVVSLIFTLPQFPYVLSFYTRHPLIIFHSTVMALCAGFGQILIFFTIQNFGAMKFATVMTARMVISVLLSIFWYGHSVTTTAWIGMLITFAALFYQAAASPKNKK